MCVGARSPLASRAGFLSALGAAAALPSLADAAGARAVVDAPAASALPAATAEPTPGNARAIAIAAASPFARANYAADVALARDIGDPSLRASVLALLADPKPAYAARHPTPASRDAVRAALVAAGFYAPGAPLAGIFPPGIDGARAPQPFWSAGGSTQGSHHAYPGGLAAHERFNATMAIAYARTYDAIYFGGTAAVDTDVAIGAALYHDVMKSVVFQWNVDGTLFAEATIAGTGAHHALSGAEAIARGRDARFVIALLSAHAAPSLGDEAKVVDWCRAAATIAGVDPIDYGLVVRDGTGYRLAPVYVPAEAFVNHLSDHDYVVSVHAVHEVRPLVLARGDAWYANRVLANASAVALYQTLATKGRAAFDAMVEAASD